VSHSFASGGESKGNRAQGKKNTRQTKISGGWGSTEGGEFDGERKKTFLRGLWTGRQRGGRKGFSTKVRGKKMGEK